MPRLILPQLVVFLALCAGGCLQSGGPPKKVCYPVKGELLVKDKPAEGATVVFRPQGEPNQDEWSSGFPRAYVGADGKFQVGTYGDNDGAPAGEYVLLVSWMAPNPQNEEAPSIDRLGGRYNDPVTSKLIANVEPRPNELAPIRLP